MPKLTKRLIDNAEPGEQRRWLWDSEVHGFGCCVHPSARAVFYLKYRTAAGTIRKPKIGAHGEVTVHQARAIARQWLADVAKGGDPSSDRKVARAAPTVADLAKRYLSEHARPHKKESSVRMDEINLRKHVVPVLGARKVAEVSHSDVVRLHQAIGAEKPGAANRVLALLSKTFNLAEKWGLRPLGSNPCRHVSKYREKKCERYLRPDEYERLAAAIDAAVDEQEIEPLARDVLWLLILTGCRLGEVLGLRLSDYDGHRRELVLADAKTGGRRVPLSSAAVEVVERVLAARLDETPGGWMFPRPGAAGERLTTDWIWYRWRPVRDRAKLDKLRLHDLRHAFASVAAAKGESLITIGALLGHRSPATTARYAHLGALHDVADRIGSEIVGSRSGRVVSLDSKRGSDG